MRHQVEIHVDLERGQPEQKFVIEIGTKDIVTHAFFSEHPEIWEEVTRNFHTQLVDALVKELK